MRSTPPKHPPLPARPVRTLARQSGVHYSLISMLLNGKRRLTLDSGQALAAAYGLPLQQFMDRLKATVTRNQERARKKPRRRTKEKKTR